MTTQQCARTVFSSPQADYGYPCAKPVKVVRDGKPYCTIHDPVRIKEKRKTLQAVWDEKWAREYKERYRREVVNRICEGIPTEVLESHTQDIRKYIEGLS